MSKDKLVCEESRYGYKVVWWIEVDPGKDYEYGAELGDAHPHDPQSKDAHDISSRAAFAASPPDVIRGGYHWESKARAAVALREANAALKVAQSKVPLPDWAQKALAAGWKMPKGWKP